MGRGRADINIAPRHIRDLESLCERGKTANGVPLSRQTLDKLREMIARYKELAGEETIVDSR